MWVTVPRGHGCVLCRVVRRWRVCTGATVAPAPPTIPSSPGSARCRRADPAGAPPGAPPPLPRGPRVAQTRPGRPPSGRPATARPHRRTVRAVLAGLLTGAVLLGTARPALAVPERPPNPTPGRTARPPRPPE